MSEMWSPGRILEDIKTKLEDGILKLSIPKKDAKTVEMEKIIVIEGAFSQMGIKYKNRVRCGIPISTREIKIVKGMIELNKLSVYILKRYLLLLAGLAIMAFGVAFSIKASLGTSPISSVPYVVSLFAPLTVGTATIVMHCVFILLQILILRRQYHPIQLMQLPVAVLFGYLTDFGVWAVRGIQCDTYWQQWIVCMIGILLVAAGVSLEVKAGVVVLAGEGVVLAICKVLPVKFGYMKVGFDVTLVITACILSLVFTGRLQGVREGTVAAALMVGLIAKQFGKVLAKWELEK